MALFLAGFTSAFGDTVFKAGLILNKGDEESYSWIIIQETNYFIKNLISIGYETQFSYYKVTSLINDEQFENNAFPLNVFFNSKLKILKKGIFRPYAGAGFGLLTNVINYPQEFGIEKYSAFHLMMGLNIGKSSSASLQIEFSLLSCSKKNSKAKFLLACGIQY